MEGIRRSCESTTTQSQLSSSIAHMKRFLKKIGRGKSPEPPEQPIPLRKSTSVAFRPPGLRAELDVTIPGDGGRNVSDNDVEADHTHLTVPPNEGGTIGPRVLFQDGMDGNQELPTSRTSTSCAAISGTDHRNQLASECYRSSLRLVHHSSRRSVFPS